MVQVVAALIWENERFLICRRPAHKTRGLLWEFVGGKVEKGETKKDALIRECREELDVIIKPHDVFMTVVHEYPDMTVELTLFNAEIESGTLRLLEHSAAEWITPDEIKNFDFCPADEEILERIQTESTAKKAMSLLKKDDLTLALISEGETVTSNERGVKTLLGLYESGKTLESFCAADKVVGKGAAVLFSLLRVKAVYADVLGEEAKEILEENGVFVLFNSLTKGIINRRGDGPCPIEKAVGEERDLQKALLLIKNRINEMKKSG